MPNLPDCGESLQRLELLSKCLFSVTLKENGSFSSLQSLDTYFNTITGFGAADQMVGISLIKNQAQLSTYFHDNGGGPGVHIISSNQSNLTCFHSK